MKSDCFSDKSGFLCKKVCYKVSLCEICQQKSCKACLTEHMWFVGNVPFDLKFWIKLTHPLLKRLFPVDICSYSHSSNI